MTIFKEIKEEHMRIVKSPVMLAIVLVAAFCAGFVDGFFGALAILLIPTFCAIIENVTFKKYFGQELILIGSIIYSLMNANYIVAGFCLFLLLIVLKFKTRVVNIVLSNKEEKDNVGTTE